MISELIIYNYLSYVMYQYTQCPHDPPPTLFVMLLVLCCKWKMSYSYITSHIHRQSIEIYYFHVYQVIMFNVAR